MRVLRNDTYSRRPMGMTAAPRRHRSGALFAVLVFVSITLLVLSKLNHDVIASFRAQIAEFMAPVLSIARVPAQPLRRIARDVKSYAELLDERRQLKKEIRQLKERNWRAAELERRMSQLSRLARVVREPALDFVSGRVIADASGPFVRIALIGAGSANGVANGYPVINGDGLVGRIMDTSASASRLLLLTDLNSRVPVRIGPMGVRGLVLGDNGPIPKLGYLRVGAKVEAGDEVYTSGLGGLFPLGLRIGFVKKSGSGWRVDLHARLDDLDYVSVLFFTTPVLDALTSTKAQRHSRLVRRAKGR